MSQENMSPKAFTSTEALEAFRRVKLTAASGTAVEYADQTDSSSFIGITMEASVITTSVAVQLKGMQQSFKCTAADSFDVGATLYAADDGKVSDSASGNAIGTALEAATADDDIVECLLDNGAGTMSWARAQMTQDNAAVYHVPLTDMRVWNAMHTLAVVTTAAADDLAFVAGTFGTSNNTLNAGDLQDAGLTTMKVGFQFAMPVEYTAAETITLRVKALVATNVADTSCTLDAEVTNFDDPTEDICATAVTDMNDTTVADIDFTITATDVTAGDLLDVVLTIACTDAATSAEVLPTINAIQMLLDVKG